MAQTKINATLIPDDDATSKNIISDMAAKEINYEERQELPTKESSQATVDEYLKDVMQHMRSRENETAPDVSFMDLQPEFHWLMRMDLIDFLVETHYALDLLPETLFLATNLLDRYSTKRVVHARYCALLGCAVLLVAAKYGDLRDNVPQIDKLHMFCRGLYDTGMFIQMEMHILHTLEWNIGHFTVEAFWPFMLAEGRLDQDTQRMARYICEIAIYQRDFVSTKPMTMARACLHLAKAVLSGCKLKFDGLNPSEIKTLMSLSQHLRQPSPTLFRKHSTKHFSNVSERLADFLAREYALCGCRAEPLPSTKYHRAPNLHHTIPFSTKNQM